MNIKHWSLAGSSLYSGVTFLLCVSGSLSTASAQFGANPTAKPVAEVPSVTVTAPKPPDPEQLAGDSVPKFIAAHARPARATGQLARWHQGICPTTSGLTPAFNAFVSARIEAVAAMVGVPHKEAGHCRTNIEIVFTADPERTIDAVSKHASALLGYNFVQDAQKKAIFSNPIRGWYVTATQGDNGEIGLDAAMPTQHQVSDTSNIPQSLLSAGTTPGHRLGSRLATGVNSLLMNVLVVADTRKVTGYTVGSISDYLSMLVLSQTQSPDMCAPLPSILDLMASRCDAKEKPEAVTAGDLAFLHALYSTDLRENLSLEANDIENAMMRQFKAR
jgi:hypothetical protein